MKDIILILNRIDRANYYPDERDINELTEVYNELYELKREYILKNSDILKNHFKIMFNETVIREPGIMQKDSEISAILEDIKAVILETIAGYWPDMLKNDHFKKHFDNLPGWIKGKYINQPVVIRKEEKPCKALTRAKAFCILLLRKEGILSSYQTKKELEEIVKGYWPDGSGRTIYDDYFRQGFSLDEKDDYKLDYEYGLKLFDEIKRK